MNLRTFTTAWTAVFVLSGATALEDVNAAAAPRYIATPQERTGPPPPGRYEGQLCVSTAGAPLSCGPAQLQFQSNTVWVQVSDLIYRLQLHSGQTEVVLLHGDLPIDQFVADYFWAPHAMAFGDMEKDVRYEVRWEVPEQR
jgi:hypothetical protein